MSKLMPGIIMVRPMSWCRSPTSAEDVDTIFVEPEIEITIPCKLLLFLFPFMAYGALFHSGLSRAAAAEGLELSNV